MKKILAIVLFSLLLGGTAFSACTETELQEKVVEFANLSAKLVEKDAEGYQKLTQSMQSELPQLMQDAQNNDYDAVCKFYDDWIAKIK